MPQSSRKGEYIIEFLAHGKSVKVSAIDAVTLREVSIVGPTSASKAELQALAVRKLEYVLNKQAKAESAAPTTLAKGRGGIIV